MFPLWSAANAFGIYAGFTGFPLGLLIGIAGIILSLVLLLRTSEKTLAKQVYQQQQEQSKARILREIERDEFRNLQARWARKRAELATDCDKCGRPAVEAKKYSWYRCGHEAILFACEKCALPYEMPCPTCADQKRIALEQRWRWLLKAAAYFHVRQRFIK